MGSPRPAAQQISVRPAVTRLFIHSLLLQQGAVCAASIVKAAFLMSSSSAASFPVSLFPSPLSRRLSPPSLYPSPSSFLPPSLPPSVRLIRLYAAKPKCTGRGTREEGEGSEAETVRTEREQNRQANEQPKRGEGAGREGSERMEEWVSGRVEEEGKAALVAAMGVPLPSSCEVKSLPWF